VAVLQRRVRRAAGLSPGVCLTSDGLSWQCYLGDEAVRQGIIGRDFLGEYAPEPGRG
jgi:hypothetical protein